MKFFKKIIACIVALVLVVPSVLLFSSCKDNNENPTNEQNTTITEDKNTTDPVYTPLTEEQIMFAIKKTQEYLSDQSDYWYPAGFEKGGFVQAGVVTEDKTDDPMYTETSASYMHGLPLELLSQITAIIEDEDANFVIGEEYLLEDIEESTGSSFTNRRFYLKVYQDDKKQIIINKTTKLIKIEDDAVVDEYTEYNMVFLIKFDFTTNQPVHSDMAFYVFGEPVADGVRIIGVSVDYVSLKMQILDFTVDNSDEGMDFPDALTIFLEWFDSEITDDTYYNFIEEEFSTIYEVDEVLLIMDYEFDINGDINKITRNGVFIEEESRLADLKFVYNTISVYATILSR